MCTSSDANAGEQRASEEHRHAQSESFARTLYKINEGKPHGKEKKEVDG